MIWFIHQEIIQNIEEKQVEETEEIAPSAKEEIEATEEVAQEETALEEISENNEISQEETKEKPGVVASVPIEETAKEELPAEEIPEEPQVEIIEDIVTRDSLSNRDIKWMNVVLKKN